MRLPRRIAVDDIVVMPVKTRSQIAVGKVTGGYRYLKDAVEGKHAIQVNWLRPNLPRSTFKQDLLYSFGAFMTVCEISRNNALERVQAVLTGKKDAGDVLADATRSAAGEEALPSN